MRSNYFKILLAFLVIFSSLGQIEAQVVKTKKREYKKAIRKKKRELKRADYTAKGVGTLELYVTEAINKEFELNDEGENVNAVVYTSFVDPTFEGAVSACRAAARATMAGNIQTNVAELVKRSINTNQVSAKSAEGINKTIIAGKQLIAQKVSIEDIYVLYREIMDERDGKTLVEVEYACYYSKRMAMEMAEEHVRKELSDEVEELHNDLDKIFEF